MRIVLATHVTDNASSTKAAFYDNVWLGCSCHNLNLVLQHGFTAPTGKAHADDTDDYNEGLPYCVAYLISTCKELVRLVKKIRLNSLVHTTLKQNKGGSSDSTKDKPLDIKRSCANTTNLMVHLERQHRHVHQELKEDKRRKMQAQTLDEVSLCYDCLLRQAQ